MFGLIIVAHSCMVPLNSPSPGSPMCKFYTTWYFLQSMYHCVLAISFLKAESYGNIKAEYTLLCNLWHASCRGSGLHQSLCAFLKNQTIQCFLNSLFGKASWITWTFINSLFDLIRFLTCLWQVVLYRCRCIWGVKLISSKLKIWIVLIGVVGDNETEHENVPTQHNVPTQQPNSMPTGPGKLYSNSMLRKIFYLRVYSSNSPSYPPLSQSPCCCTSVCFLLFVWFPWKFS